MPAPSPVLHVISASAPGRRWTGAAVFLLGGVSLVLPSGYSIGALMLVLASIALIWRRPRLDLEPADAWVVAVLIGYALVSMLWAGWLGEGWRGLDKPLRFLMAVPAMLWVMAYPPRLAWLWSGLTLGAAGAGVWAAWQKVVEGASRVGGHTHPIQYGNLSMLLGVLCLAGLGWAVVQRRRRAWMSLLSLGALCGTLGSLLSGSRGGWIGLPLVLWVLYRAYGRQVSPRWRYAMMALVLLGGMTVYLVPQTGVQHRVEEAVDNVAQYVSGESRTTSVGARFEMWRGATRLIMEKPLAGWGEAGYKPAMQELGKAGMIAPGVTRYGHAHNEYLDAFAKRGIVGLLTLLALYLVPMRLFAKDLAAGDPSQRAVAVAGVLLSVAYIDFGLTQVFLAHNSGVMMYAFLLAVLWGVKHALQHRREPAT